MERWFKWDFGLAGAAIYTLVVIVSNYDKSLSELALLAARQAIMAFLVTGTVVAYVLRQSQHPSLFVAVVSGVILPATIVAISSFVAHWYFTQEMRNVVVPFCVSVMLNSVSVFLGRTGRTTLTSQVKFVFAKFKWPS